MAETDPVEIVVDIIDEFSDELNELRAQLEQIDAMDLDIDFDIKGDQELEAIMARIQAIPNRESVIFNARMIGMAKVRAQIASAQAQARMGLPAPERGTAGNPIPLQPNLPEVFQGGGGGGMGGGGSSVFRNIGSQIRNMHRPMRNARRSFSRIGRVLSRVTPNMMMVWNTLAAMIPVLVSLGGAAIGLAGALGALGAAGVAVVGAGLLGWGDDFSSSLDELTRKAEQLGGRLFDVMQPAANTFQPIMEDWMEGAPRQVERLVGPMQELAVYSDTLSDAGAGFIGWLADVMRSMAAMEEQVSQLAMRFGEIVGAFIIDFMENMVQFAYDNQTALLRLAASIGTLLGALLDISIAISSTLAAMSPLVELIGFFANMLNTTVGRALITATGLFLAFAAANGAVLTAVALLNSGILATVQGIAVRYIPAILSAIGITDQWIARLTALRAALLATGLGAALVIGGFALNEMMGANSGGAPSTAGSDGTGGDTYVQIEGDVGQREYDRLIDKTKGSTREELSIQEDMGQ